MSDAPVSKLMSEGLRAFSNFLRMLFEVGAGCRISVEQSAAVDYVGIDLDGRKYWIGLFYEAPEVLWFATRGKIDPAAAVRLGVGEVREASWLPHRFRWWRGVDLRSEGVHFFCRSGAGQMMWLEKYIRECITLARSIETPDQPPIPEEPEET